MIDDAAIEFDEGGLGESLTGLAEGGLGDAGDARITAGRGEELIELDLRGPLPVIKEEADQRREIEFAAGEGGWREAVTIDEVGIGKRITDVGINISK